MKKILNYTAIAVVCVLGLASTASAQLIEWQESVPMFDLDLGTVQTFVDDSGVAAVGLNASGDTSIDPVHRFAECRRGCQWRCLYGHWNGRPTR